MAIAGVVTADGKGNITSGTLDLNDSGFSAPLIANPITGGTYSVTADGRGKATLTTSTPFGSNIKVDFVLSSSAHGLITQFDNNATGSGSLDLQSNVTQAQLAGTYVFGLTGISGFDLSGNPIPAGTVGYLTIDASGNATGGMDYNNNGSAANIDLIAGSNVLVGAPGSMLLQGSSSTVNFSVYPIDATHLKVVESDGGSLILTGDMFVQTSTTFPAGNLAFTMAGLDFVNSVPVAMGGLLTSDGTTISSGVEDVDDGGVVTTTPLAVTGTATFSCCRYLVQLNGFANGGTPGTFTFAAYPSAGGLQMIEIDGLGVTGGVAFTQTSTALAATQGYAFNLSAANSNGFEEDDIAEFTTTSSSFKGVIDFNDQSQGTSSLSLNGTYTPDSPATGRGVISSGAFNGAYYTVDSGTTLFLEADQNQLGLGSLQLQSATAKSNLAQAHFTMLRNLKPASMQKNKKKPARK